MGLPALCKEVNMKKYMYLFFIMNFLSMTCMEQRRPKLFSVNYEDAATKAQLRILDVNSSINQTTVITRPITPVLLEANRGDWQKLNTIANMTYNSPTYQVVSLRHAISQQKLQQE